MDEKKKVKEDKGKERENNKKKKKGEDIDEELEQTFPASDPPSYSKPANDEKGNKKEKDD